MNAHAPSSTPIRWQNWSIIIRQGDWHNNKHQQQGKRSEEHDSNTLRTCLKVSSLLLPFQVELILNFSWGWFNANKQQTCKRGRLQGFLQVQVLVWFLTSVQAEAHRETTDRSSTSIVLLETPPPFMRPCPPLQTQWTTQWVLRLQTWNRFFLFWSLREH